MRLNNLEHLVSGDIVKNLALARSRPINLNLGNGSISRPETKVSHGLAVAEVVTDGSDFAELLWTLRIHANFDAGAVTIAVGLGSPGPYREPPVAGLVVVPVQHPRFGMMGDEPTSTEDAAADPADFPFEADDDEIEIDEVEALRREASMIQPETVIEALP